MRRPGGPKANTLEAWAAYRAELVQVAAVAVAAIEDLDRHNMEPGLLAFYHNAPPR